jgi:hypothetical protein
MLLTALLPVRTCCIEESEYDVVLGASGRWPENCVRVQGISLLRSPNGFPSHVDHLVVALRRGQQTGGGIAGLAAVAQARPDEHTRNGIKVGIGQYDRRGLPAEFEGHRAFLPGEEGGPALARVITGTVNPSGKLPVQVPRHPGINPATYLHPPLAGSIDNISSLDPTPAFPFGHGLSYTSFDYTGLHTSAAAIDTAGSVTLSVTITNAGGRAGEEIAQLYVSDPVASVTRPVRQLLGFARVPLPAGESRTVSFDIHTDRLSFIGADLERIVEPGPLELQVGSSSTDIRLRAKLELTGPVRTTGKKRQLVTPARIQLPGCAPRRA